MTQAQGMPEGTLQPSTVPTIPPANRPAARAKTGWILRIALGLSALLGIGFAVLVATLAFGARGGEEFSPTSFSRRSFYYYEIPLLRIQVTPVIRDDDTNALETLLQTKNYVTSKPPGTPRWDLVLASHAGTAAFHGDASILCNYLDATDDDGSLYWKVWTEKHPKLAAVFWPLVARVARQQLYLLEPELFELGAGEADPQRLAHRLAYSLAHQYRRLAEMHQALGDHPTALELLNEALVHAPQDRELLKLRAASQGAARK
jgi:hypothetical protein